MRSNISNREISELIFSNPAPDTNAESSAVMVLFTSLILGLRPANERLHYKVTPSLIG